MKKPKLYFSKTWNLPPRSAAKSLLIFDQVLQSYLQPHLKKWPLHYSVQAGESLKAVENFPTHIQNIVELTKWIPRQELHLISVGGGSVGDFTGFVAGVLRRGVRLWHVPSTWLAAVDSAHGGKTALNVGGVKNQIGTFYWPERIYLLQDLLFLQDANRFEEVKGEIAKVALLDGGSWLKNLTDPMQPKQFWKMLPAAIGAKYKIVQRDPIEEKNIRYLLNFGHTLGHVLESYFQLPHGTAVAQGLHFALEWSQYKKILSRTEFAKIKKLMEKWNLEPLSQQFKGQLPVERCAQLVSHDKKMAVDRQLRFVFLKKLGQGICKTVPVDEFLAEAKRQQWLS